MKRNPLIGLFLAILILQAVIIGRQLYWAPSQSADKAPSAGKVGAVKIERIQGSDVKRLILTEKAARRIDLQTAPVREQGIVRRRMVPGEVAQMSSAAVTVMAPSAGIVTALDGGTVAATGSRLSAGMAVLRLGDINTAAAGAAPAPAVELRRTAEPGQPLQRSAADAPFVRIDAPRSGSLVRMLVAPGQVVAKGQPLFEIASDRPDTAIIRVPITEDVKALSRGQTATVFGYETAGFQANPIDPPAEIGARDALKTLYYSVEGAGLMTGHRVRVAFNASGSEARKVVPLAAVIYDAKGGSWVYTTSDPLVFTRHPIKIDFIEGDLVVLAEGPATGTSVVTMGATELWGSEFYTGH